jgi:hypothetical protein
MGNTTLRPPAAKAMAESAGPRKSSVAVPVPLVSAGASKRTINAPCWALAAWLRSSTTVGFGSGGSVPVPRTG